jgi:hypothetical protein
VTAVGLDVDDVGLAGVVLLTERTAGDGAGPG